MTWWASISRRRRYLETTARHPLNVLRNVLAVLTGAIALIVGFMFSLVMLAIIAVVALAVWGYLMWKTRKVRTRCVSKRLSAM